jgi:aconitate hydratase
MALRRVRASTLAGADAKSLIGRRLPVKADARTFEVVLRIDTPMEAEYLRHGGILPYVLRQHLTATDSRA